MPRRQNKRRPRALYCAIFAHRLCVGVRIGFSRWFPVYGGEGRAGPAADAPRVAALILPISVRACPDRLSTGFFPVYLRVIGNAGRE